jgi:general secretion pathway protein G
MPGVSTPARRSRGQPPGRAHRAHPTVRGQPPRTRTEEANVTLSVANPRALGRALRAYPSARGMTLIEILVVLVLIGIVMGIVGGNFLGQGEKAKGKAAKIEIGQISQTLDLFKLEVGRYPTSQEGLQALITAPAGVTNWNGPYWKKETLPKDPWGNEYKYIFPGQHGAYDIVSYGADGKEGGEGADKDITSWDQ